jgi:hyperosmotically inducible protein
MNKPIVAALILSSVITMSYTFAQIPSSVAPDNAKSNKVDASNATATADAQFNGTADLGLTKRIRESIMADKSLSTYAHKHQNRNGQWEYDAKRRRALGG